MTSSWTNDAIFYHIYPLGLCAAPKFNHEGLPVVDRLDTQNPWLAHIKDLGANAIYLGPVFQSTSHGYDTVDYFQVDRRLGDHQSLERIANAIHQRGMHLVLDGVFNHVGRNFWAFKDVLAHGEESAYCDWFHLRFGETSPLGDPFHYSGWQGHYNLVKLKLSCPEVRTTLFDAFSFWIEKFGIDGLRLDAADCIEMDFFKALIK